MNLRLSEHDRKVLKFGAVAAAVMLVYVWPVSGWIADWRYVRTQLAMNTRTIESLRSSTNRFINQQSIVPTMEMPLEAEQQQHLFKTRMNEQLREAGVDVRSLQFVGTSRPPNSPYGSARLKCEGRGDIQKALKLLGGLPENQYLLGVEELRLSCDPRRRNEMTISLVVSTPVKTR